MIREHPHIEGIPIPDHDGRDPKDAHSADSTESEMCERGLVDDTMVALRTPADVPALLEILARFEAFSGHRMNISKSMVLLLGRHRSFDIAGKSHAAETLREHGLTAVHDVTNGDAQLPEKWHGLRLGGEDSTVAAWKAAAAAAEKRADDMQNSAIPTASRGRRAQATPVGTVYIFSRKREP